MSEDNGNFELINDCVRAIEGLTRLCEQFAERIIRLELELKLRRPEDERGN